MTRRSSSPTEAQRASPSSGLSGAIVSGSTAEGIALSPMLVEHEAVMLLIDPVTGAIVDANRAAERFYGYGRRTLTTMSITDINTLPVGEVVAQQQRAFTRQANAFIFPHRLADGSLRSVEVHSSPVTAGDRSLLLSIIHDVSDRIRAEQELVASEHRYRLIAEFTSDVVFVTDPNGLVEWMSPSVTRVLGFEPLDLVGRTPNMLMAPLQDDTLAVISRTFTAGLSLHDLRVRLITAEGDERWFTMFGRGVIDEHGDLRTYVGLRDTHDNIVAREQLSASEDLFRTSMMSNPNGMAIYALDGSATEVNPAFCVMLNRNESEIIGHDATAVAHPDDVQAAIEGFALVATGEVDSISGATRMLLPDEELVWTRWTLTLIRDRVGSPHFVVGQYQDITPALQAQQELDYSARFDKLTGLLNREGIVAALARELEHVASEQGVVGVLTVDIDSFGLVNDSLGWAAGDDLLRAVGLRCVAAVPMNSATGRAGSDQFILVIPGVDAVALEVMAASVQTAITSEVTLGHRRVIPSVTIGQALSDEESTPESLLRSAELAYRAAKSEGRAHRRLFDAGLVAEASRRLEITEQLHDGIKRHEFVSYLQPIVRLDDRVVEGYEALVRWIHPTEGLLGPIDFLAVAEETGLIVPLGLEMLDLVCGIIGEHRRFTGRISVNLSAVQLADSQVVDQFTEVISARSVDPERLIVEVTETAVMGPGDVARTALLQLRGMGIDVHVDDFGTGYSSIAVLRDLPVTGIKLDRSFVSGLSSLGGEANDLARGLAGLAAGIGLDRIAEGIETEEQARLVRAAGWELAQGYLLGRPAPPSTWLE